MSNSDRGTVPHNSHDLQQVAPDVLGMQTMIVNLFFVGTRDEWVVVDTGMPGSAGRIERMAAASVRALAGLDPSVAATGHGQPIGGATLRSELGRLAREFERLAVPESRRYVNAPAIADEEG